MALYKSCIIIIIIYGKNGQLQTKHFWFTWRVVRADFLLEVHIVNKKYHYPPIDYDQQFTAIDQVCCRKVSFFKMAVPHRAIGLLDS